jgi:hypothetical protein
MKTMILTLISLLLLPNLLFATGDQRGNGGNIIICSSSGNKTYELLDLYEGRATSGFAYVPVAGRDYSEILLQRIKTLERWNPRRAELYRTYFKEFGKEALFVPEGQFAPVGDTGPAVYPKECELKQVVVQWDRPTPSGYRYFINQDLWEPMPAEQKAALLLHEFIYREGRLPQNDFGNSLGARYFTAYLHSDLIGKSTLKSYLDQLRYVGFQEAEYHGVPIWLYTWDEAHTVKKAAAVDFYSDDHVAWAHLADHFPVPGVRLPSNEFVCLKPIEFDWKHRVEFFDGSGNVKTLAIDCGELDYDFKTDLGEGTVVGNLFYYNDEGKILSISASWNLRRAKMGALFIYYLGQRTLEVQFSRENDWLTVYFYPGTNKPKSLDLTNSSSFFDSSHEIHSFPIGFDSRGGVISLDPRSLRF